MSEDLYARIAETDGGHLIKHKSVRRWIDGLPKPFFYDNGRVRYVNYLRELDVFLGWLSEKTGEEWTPERLVNERVKQRASLDIPTRRWVEEKIQKYYKATLSERAAKSGKRKGQPISDALKQAAVNAVASFLKYNYVELGRLTIRRKVRRATKDYWFKLEDIRAICDPKIAAPWERAYILHNVSFGLRRGDVVNFTWNDIWPYIADVGKGEIVGPFMIYTRKNEVEARPFLSPEAVEALKQLRFYQEERGYLGEHVYRNGQEDKPYKEDHVNRRLQILFKRGGRKSHGLTVRTHGLRKLLYNEMKNVGVPLDVRNLIVGKTVSEDIRTYITDDELRKWFKAVLPRISLEEPRPETATNLKRRIGELESKVTRLEKLREADMTRLRQIEKWRKGMKNDD